MLRQPKSSKCVNLKEKLWQLYSGTQKEPSTLNSSLGFCYPDTWIKCERLNATTAWGHQQIRPGQLSQGVMSYTTTRVHTPHVGHKELLQLLSPGTSHCCSCHRKLLIVAAVNGNFSLLQLSSGTSHCRSCHRGLLIVEVVNGNFSLLQLLSPGTSHQLWPVRLPLVWIADSTTMKKWKWLFVNGGECNRKEFEPPTRWDQCSSVFGDYV